MNALCRVRRPSGAVDVMVADSVLDRGDAVVLSGRWRRRVGLHDEFRYSRPLTITVPWRRVLEVREVVV